MAALKNTLVKKLTEILSTQFPPPAKLRLEDSDGIIGVITSDQFNGMDSFERYDFIHSILESKLTPAERRQVQVVVGVTPAETEFYEAVPTPKSRKREG